MGPGSLATFFSVDLHTWHVERLDCLLNEYLKSPLKKSYFLPSFLTSVFSS